MKTHSDELFKLIKSLTKAEKRQFIIEVSKKNTRPHFIQLFKIINNLKTYDEIALNEQLRKHKIDTHLLSSYKYYLKQTLYAFLRNLMLNQPKDELDRISQHIASADALYNRGLYKESIKLLEKAKSLCQKFGILELQLYCNKLERNILFRAGELVAQKSFKTLLTEQQTIAKQLVNYNDILLLWEDVWAILVDCVGKRFSIVHNHLHAYLEHPLLKCQTQALSQNALRTQFYTKAYLIKYLNYHDTKWFEDYFSLTHYMSESVINKALSTYYYLDHLLTHQEFNTFTTIYPTLQTLETNKEDEISTMQSILYVLQLRYAIYTKSDVPKATELVLRNDRNFGVRILLYEASLDLRNHHYRYAKRKLYQLITLHSNHKDYQFYGHVLYLISLVLLKNDTELIEKAISDIIHYNKGEAVSEFETELCAYIQVYYYSPTGKILEKVKQKLIAALNTLEGTCPVYELLYLFDFRAWIQNNRV